MSARGNLIANGCSTVSIIVLKDQDDDGIPGNLERVHGRTIKSLGLGRQGEWRFVLASEG